MDDPTDRPRGGSIDDPDSGPGGEAPEAGPHPGLKAEGPLSADTARQVLDRGADYAAAGDWDHAAAHYRRVIGNPDPAVTAAALLGLGQALYRLDDETSALAAWEAILELPETPSTYRAWREVAAARVRDGDLQGAIAAYREADRRAPLGDRPEIANRLGWLAKETGNTGAARRYFAKGRGDRALIPLTWIILGVTVVVSLSARTTVDGQQLFDLLQLDKGAVAAGEYWRLWTITLLHADEIHLAFNMYALFLIGPIVEQIYGARLFLLFYLLTAAAGSTASFVFGGDVPAVGASGAIFGLVGILLAASRAHHPVLDRRARALVGQLGFLILLNLALGFANPRIDNAGHIGGLLGGLWLGYLLVPGRVQTLSRTWQRPAGEGQGGAQAQSILRLLGVVALVLVLAVGIVIGTEERRVGGAVSPGPAVAIGGLDAGREMALDSGSVGAHD
jgi:rhomboid protease GluP